MDKKDLKILLTSDIEGVLEKLKHIIPSESKIYDDFIIALSRHNDLKREVNNGVLSPMEKNIELNKIRGSILYVINSLDSLEVSNQYNDLIEVSKSISGVNENVNLDDEEELGLFEVEELLLSTGEDLQANLSRITEGITELGEKIQEDANKLTRLNKSGSSTNKTLIRKIVDNTAKTMHNYAEIMKVETPVFKEFSSLNTSYSLEYIKRLYELGLDNHKEKIIKFQESIILLINSAKKSRISLTGMYEEINSVPGLTTQFIKSKSEIIKILDYFFKYYDEYLNDLEKLDSGIKNMLLEIEN